MHWHWHSFQCKTYYHTGDGHILFRYLHSIYLPPVCCPSPPLYLVSVSLLCVVSVPIKLPNLGRYKYWKTLKISVFGCSEIYLVEFGFVSMTLSETLIFFDLKICSSELFGKLWIWFSLLKKYQIIICKLRLRFELRDWSKDEQEPSLTIPTSNLE